MNDLRMSTKGEYGIRAMLDLTTHYGSGPITLKSIAERQGISENYLEQLFGSLRKSGLVRSVRGAQGGYELAAKPEKILVGDVIRVLEGPIGPTQCASDDCAEDCCDRSGACAAQILWQRIRAAIIDVVDTTSLRDLADEADSLRCSGRLQSPPASGATE